MVETDLQYELVYHTLHHYWTTRTGSEDDDSRDIALEAIFDEWKENEYTNLLIIIVYMLVMGK